MKKILIAGANGFIARHLAGHFAGLGWDVAGLARRQEGLHGQCRHVAWDGRSPGGWLGEIDRCDVLINLAGRPVNCRHNTDNKRRILESRVDSTRLLGEAVAGSGNPPALWINGSAAGIYRETSARPNNEDGRHGEGFLADVVKAWEGAFFSAKIPEGVRRVALRTTMVLADEPGNPFRILSLLAKLGLGGSAGSGRQMVSWIHIDDVVRAVEFIIGEGGISGPVNLAAPDAVTNAGMMRRFRKRAGVPFGIPAPAAGVRLGAFVMGTAPRLILASSWVAPEKLLEHGFKFAKPEMSLREW